MNVFRFKTKCLHICVLTICGLASLPADASTFTFSTGSPDGQIATLTRLASPGKLETETADDFVTTESTAITNATFTGLLPLGTPVAPYRKWRSSSITSFLSIQLSRPMAACSCA